LKEEALDISRSCEYASGGSHLQVKRIVSILLKELEQFMIDSAYEFSQANTPRQGIK
jgi:hypothetical protein